MTFQAYLDTIKAKTGLDPEDFRALARDRGLLEPGVTAGQIKSWLKADFGLGPGHAMALISILTPSGRASGSTDDKIDAIFSGAKTHWRLFADTLIETLRESGRDLGLAPTNTYLSLVSEGRKFAILHPTAARLDIGIKRKGVAPTERFEAAGSWNAMVTHRVRIDDDSAPDNELLEWLREAHSGT
ncbi:DUF4287 domain-containing protein [Glaciihabitans sp. INWT7]|uniref:DUF4287 domain-containing protein n=1 Tax=Glaciihabitans sp. INWT7 TaxID=2596912 RepID=UPI001627DDE9|nr:DUF4287 domain-containing protein [Glaciihabitans sp. INWT7]QNE46772.1 DUF4287 domain-containing protein [Glaciihabitans sp. INWT7]